MNLISTQYFSEEEICQIMRIKRTTLKSRISRGTEHPPFVVIGRERYYPKQMFYDWASKKPLMYSVKDAS